MLFFAEIGELEPELHSEIETFFAQPREIKCTLYDINAPFAPGWRREVNSNREPGTLTNRFASEGLLQEALFGCRQRGGDPKHPPYGGAESPGKAAKNPSNWLEIHLAQFLQQFRQMVFPIPIGAIPGNILGNDDQLLHALAARKTSLTASR